MPLTLVRAADTRTLWEAFTSRFLDEVGDNPGPAGFAAHAWLAQESQLDLLYEEAVARGVKGWLGPPVTTLRQLGSLFELRGRRVGLLTRRRLVSRIASTVAAQVGMTDPSRQDGVVRGHMLDAVFGELLPEGITPAHLRASLATLHGDDFARRRNDWIARSYERYLQELARLERIDNRQTWALVADAIDAGGLHDALRGASALHVYGLYMPRSRQRLLTALAKQTDIDVRLYTLRPAPEDPERSEWETFAQQAGASLEELDGDAPATAFVQPAPDTQRETEWVARQVKRLLLERGVEPHRIAVIARSGHEDTGRMHRALREAGVTATTVVRAVLTEIASLKALLSLFRGAADLWSYTTLRPVLDNTLFDIDLDLRSIDFIARQRRVQGLDAWEAELARLSERLADDKIRNDDKKLKYSGLWPDTVTADLEAFRAVRSALEPLAAPRTEAEWIELTLAMVRQQHPASFHLRRRLCDPPGGSAAADPDATGADGQRSRMDVVRLDQRGLHQCEVLLGEWLELERDTDPGEPLDASAWFQLLGRMLEANELSLSTPVHKGVQVLEAHDAALLPFEHVFVVHANDGVFPKRMPPGGVLSASERERLRAAGVPMTHRELDMQRERALWQAVTSAGSVRITYRSADPEGTPLLPSLLVPPHDPTTELPRTRARITEQDDRFTAVTAAQANRRAAVAFREYVEKPAGQGSAEPPPLHPGTPDLLPHAVVAAVAEVHRDTGAEPLQPESPALRPNPWNGWLRDPRLLAWLAQRFGPDYLWSASALENYSKLPFQFLLQRVLRYEEAAEAEEDTTPLVLGSVAHDLLEAFYRRLLGNVPAEFDARAAAAFEEASAETLARFAASDEWLGAPLLWREQWKRLQEQVRAYLVWELTHLHDKGEVAVQVERAFGDDDARVVIAGTDVDGAPARLRLRGRIDRVELKGTGAKASHQVLDYKLGVTPGANDFEDGTALQAPLYMQVLEDEGRSVSLGYYRSLKPFKDKPTQYAGKVARTSDNYAAALRFAFSIPGRIRAGLFEPVRARKAGDWPRYAAKRDIARSQAVLTEGNRYENLPPLQPEPGPDADA